MLLQVATHQRLGLDEPRKRKHDQQDTTVWQGAADGKDSLPVGSLQSEISLPGQWLKDHCLRLTLWVRLGSTSATVF